MKKIKRISDNNFNLKKNLHSQEFIQIQRSVRIERIFEKNHELKDLWI